MFKLLTTDGNARRGEFTTVHGTVQTPVFMNVGTLAAIKGADDGNGYIVRLFNPFDSVKKAVLNFNIINKSVEVTVAPYEIKSLHVTDTVFQCGLLENKL